MIINFLIYLVQAIYARDSLAGRVIFPLLPSVLKCLLEHDRSWNLQLCVCWAELAMLQSKFEQDKKRIQELRAQRKFKPY